MDARDRIQDLGGLSYMYSYMSQPKHQLETFKAWAGKSSDISYYLNRSTEWGRSERETEGGSGGGEREGEGVGVERGREIVN